MWPENQLWSPALYGNPLTQVWHLTSEGVNKYWADYFYSKTSSLASTFHHVTWKSIGFIYFLGWSTVSSLATFLKKVVKRYWADIICTKTGSLTLPFDHVTSKSIGNIYFLGASTVPSLPTFKPRGLKILSGHHLVYRPTDRRKTIYLF